MTRLVYYIFTDIPGAGKNWTLAVLATGKIDACNYPFPGMEGGPR
jgi:hypothetical protein